MIPSGRLTRNFATALLDIALVMRKYLGFDKKFGDTKKAPDP